MVVSNPTDYILKKTLRSQLRQLSQDGYTLEDARAQCVIAYFKMVLMLQLKYDPDFCNVVHPEKIWRMLQVDLLINSSLFEYNSENIRKH